MSKARTDGQSGGLKHTPGFRQLQLSATQPTCPLLTLAVDGPPGGHLKLLGGEDAHQGAVHNVGLLGGAPCIYTHDDASYAFGCIARIYQVRTSPKASTHVLEFGSLITKAPGWAKTVLGGRGPSMIQDPGIKLS